MRAAVKALLTLLIFGLFTTLYEALGFAFNQAWMIYDRSIPGCGCYYLVAFVLAVKAVGIFRFRPANCYVSDFGLLRRQCFKKSFIPVRSLCIPKNSSRKP